jgi:hypothetical protein
MRATLDSLGDDRRVWVADSFQGFPQPEPGSADEALETDMGANDYFAPGLDAVKGYFERFGVAEGVEFVPGFFEQTMAGLAGRSWAMIRLDADGYAATRLVLDTLYGGLARCGYVVVDDYFTPGLDVCRDAVDGFRAERGIEDPITRIDWTGARWRKTAEAEPVGATLPKLAEVSTRTAWSASGESIPTDREMILQSELETLHRRVAELELALAGQRRPWWRFTAG